MVCVGIVISESLNWGHSYAVTSGTIMQLFIRIQLVRAKNVELRDMTGWE
jgi:hypothetical protein